ncbi:phosphotransferase family protein [Alphaproteobacteria bacterium]|nr:phosphotransferase family protein [Alphaproteobacteria bacterium]
MEKNIDNIIRSIPIWKNTIEISKIEGGLTNQNFLIQDNQKKFVVRLGEDIPEHLISRSNEIIASKAAAEFNIGPKVVYNSKGILVLKYIESIALSAENVKDKIDTIIPLIKKIHFEMPKKIIGQSLIFWVFHVIRNYENYLKNKKSPYTKLLPELLHKCEILEKKSSPYEIVFGHNDLLPANFLDDGSRLWIIDWEYAGFNTPLFDLGGLASNNNFSQKQEIYLLENYFEKKINDEILLKYSALKCASLLRETMWSMVSELTSKIDFDYKYYTQENLSKFNQGYKEFNI